MHAGPAAKCKRIVACQRMPSCMPRCPGPMTVWPVLFALAGLDLSIHRSAETMFARVSIVNGTLGVY